jgi:hypothetical protein
MSSPIYATAIGLLIHGIDMQEKIPAMKMEVEEIHVEEQPEPKQRFGGKLIDRMFAKTKEFFEATPDSEL